jgi:(R,R)-butanediol dehydrogenase/meso-butanediol dehydrogenase/diacetyl reductase
MRAVQWNAPEDLTLVELDEPHASDGQLVVEVATCGICGSDLHSYSHGVAAEPGQVLGHEFSGRVVEAPGVEGVAVGDRVTVRPLLPCGECDRCKEGLLHLCEGGRKWNIGYGLHGAFADRVLVPKAIVGETVFKLPDSIGDEAGALVEPLSVGLRVVRQAGELEGTVCLVLGAGMIGLAATRFAKLRGPKTLIVADPSPVRREAASKLGADITIDPIAQKITDVVREITGPGGYGLGARADVVIDCAGAAPAFAEGLKSVRHGGTIAMTAMYNSKIEVNPSRWVEKELTIKGSFAYNDEFPMVIEAIENGDIDPSVFVSHTFALEDFERAFRTQLDRGVSLKVMVTP